MTYRITDTTTTGAGAGTITNTGTTITGSGSSFLTQLADGRIIHDLVSGQTMVVATVSSNVSCTVVTAPAVALTGGAYTISTPVDVTALAADAVDPLGSYYRWQATKDLGNGLARALGRPRASWLFKNPSTALRAALQALCTGKSARVYICTLIDPSNNTFATYQAAMLWPDTDNAYNNDFVIEFRDLVAL